MSDFVIENGVLKKYTGKGGDVVIPDGVTEVGNRAFTHCERLKSVIIPSSVTKISYSQYYGEGAFSNCTDLTSVTLPEGMTSIGNNAFYGCQSLTSVTIPKSVTEIGADAFYGCFHLTGVTLPAELTEINDRTFRNCTNLQTVTIPDGVTSIGRCAFEECRSLTNVTVPDSVTSIGESAFGGCRSLTSVTLPESLSEIGDRAFWGCVGLQDEQGLVIVRSVLYYCAKEDAMSVTIPDGVTGIGSRAFAWRESLTSVTIPASVGSIGSEAFAKCESLTSVMIPASVTSIGGAAFAECGSIVVHFENLRVQLGEKVFNNDTIDFSGIELAGFTLFQPVQICRDLGIRWRINADNADEVANLMITLLGAGTKEAKAGTKAAEFVLERLQDIKRETLRALEKVLEEKKYKTALKKLWDDPAIGALQQQEEKNPIEELVQENWVYDDTVKMLKRAIKSGVPYAGSKKVSTPQAVIFVCWAYNWEQGCAVSAFDPIADQVAETLDKKALIELLEQQVFENGSRRCLGALARYGGEKQAVHIISSMQKLKKKWGRDVNRLMLFSDTKAAIIYVERKGWLRDYAALRGTDVETVWDKTLLDFGLDKDGKKVYDLGGRNVTASVGADLEIVLYDEAGKIVKSLPRRGTDPGKLAAASEDLAEMKKGVKKVARARSDTILEQFLSGWRQEAGKWKELYMGDPILRSLARLVVWQQGSDTFTLGTNGSIKSDGTAYTITDGPVGVAHPMEMEPTEVSAWQQYFISRGLKQPFEQVWEPVIDPRTVRRDRYEGCTVPDKVFMNKNKHGIDCIFYLDEGFDYRFNLRLIGCELERSPSEEENESVLGKFSFKNYTRQVNHIVALLDRWTVAGRILKDDVSVREQLDGFTAAQIMEYIRLATENACPNCTAMLLEYKQAHYPNFDPMAEFTLE